MIEKLKRLDHGC
jgi:hypothetical protein